mmetsp:Transcript_21117/g.39632  ORF Transcript_21117/g.39632 Transcript_21117/m.39632 type:complete len:294 (-) Transcript_21117:361-1242(-)
MTYSCRRMMVAVPRPLRIVICTSQALARREYSKKATWTKAHESRLRERVEEHRGRVQSSSGKIPWKRLQQEDSLLHGWTSAQLYEKWRTIESRGPPWRDEEDRAIMLYYADCKEKYGTGSWHHMATEVLALKGRNARQIESRWKQLASRKSRFWEANEDFALIQAASQSEVLDSSGRIVWKRVLAIEPMLADRTTYELRRRYHFYRGHLERRRYQRPKRRQRTKRSHLAEARVLAEWNDVESRALRNSICEYTDEHGNIRWGDMALEVPSLRGRDASELKAKYLGLPVRELLC